MRSASLLGLATVVLTSACTEPPPVKPIPEASRRNVVAVAGEVSGQKQSDTSTLGARGSNEGARLGAEDGASRVPPAGPIGIMAKIASAAVGGVKGASEAQSEEVVDAARSSLSRAIAEAEFGEQLRKRLASSKAGRIEIVGVAGEGTAPAAGARLPDQSIAIDYRLSLQSEHLVNPKVGIQVQATAFVRDSAAGQPLHQATWYYCGERDHFVKMAADDAAAVRTQIDRAATVLAEAIPHDLYVANNPRPLQSSKPRCMDFSDLPGAAAHRPAGQS